MIPELTRYDDRLGSDKDGLAQDPWLLLEEMTHRVVNEYALAICSLSLAAARSESPQSRGAILGAANRLWDFANAHRALQPRVNHGVIDLADYLRGICTAMMRASLDERGIRLSLLEQSVLLEAGRCWRVGLILSELIVNAARHGFGSGSGFIRVEIWTEPGQVHCQVTDNGRACATPVPGRGSAIIAALAGELGGRFQRWFGDGGTTALLSFPQDAGMAARFSTPVDETCGMQASLIR